ncbi:MAG: hypothetical protein QN188_02150 [Armatimonadota bacterium]|nr:hypothetical protein [Armatimonadota bacterium]MDR7446021.1 hypothetical protein [Armatimonadota bacterium]MDR7477633.1 hypothetical protein [Armatimonadota bacterium]MDR7514545.1 hypothetical protein [Armatimonadota bacterium]MDR7525038.1 hypothetical protein [Armatimonadota bacterium]
MVARAYVVEGIRRKGDTGKLLRALEDDRRFVRLKLALVAVLYLCAGAVLRGG